MDLRRARLISLDLTDTQSSDHFNCQSQLTSVPTGTEFVLSRQPTSRVLASRFRQRASVYRQKVPHAPPHCFYVLCARLSSLSGYSVYRQKVPHAPHTPHGSVLGSRASAGTVCIV